MHRKHGGKGAIAPWMKNHGNDTLIVTQNCLLICTVIAGTSVHVYMYVYGTRSNKVVEEN